LALYKLVLTYLQSTSSSTNLISVIDDIMHGQESLEYDHPTSGLSPLQQMFYKVWNGHITDIGAPDQVYSKTLK